MRRQRAALGLEAADLDDWSESDRYVTHHNGVTHLVLRQRFGGIEVFNADMSVAITPEGRMLSLGHRFISGLARLVSSSSPSLSALTAVARAAEHLGLVLTQPPSLLEPQAGPAREARVAGAGVSLDEIPVKLMYLPRAGGEVRLCWNLVLRPPGGQHWWDVYVDAQTGDVLAQNDWVNHDSYRVYPLPLLSPAEGPRTLEVDPADLQASPFGWHDLDGLPGADTNDTSGNNVSAQEDRDANNSGGFAPDGGPQRTFDFALDLSQHPGEYESAAITNLFYWNNLLHDIHYRYGFDEASGNFQHNNYDHGGLAGDPVIADAQDGAGASNATFATPADGTSPRMQMFHWFPEIVTVNSPESSAGEYAAGSAQFGPFLNPTGVTQEVVLALDAADANGPSETDACSTLTNPSELAGKIALIERGICFFVVKVRHAQDAGAIAAIVVNNAGDERVTMGGSDPTIAIPSAFLGQSDGEGIEQALQGGASVHATLARPVRDGDLDIGLIIHEYGHGVSSRLTGGGSNPNCLLLVHSRGMAEGWSDWWALAMTAMLGERGEDSRGLATYLLGGASDRQGIRRFPYSTDLRINPLTLGDFALSTEEHDLGEIWALALWELYWKLVDAHGFDPDLYQGSGGNNLALQLVMDALKLQPCNPTFLEARDAILAADLIGSAGTNRCPIWAAFARRGMGLNADDGGSAGSPFVSEDFELPQECRDCGDVNADGGVNLLDTVILRRALAARSPGLLAAERCNVAGATDATDANADGLPDDCDAGDVEVLRAHLAGLPPGINPVCSPAIEPLS